MKTNLTLMVLVLIQSIRQFDPGWGHCDCVYLGWHASIHGSQDRGGNLVEGYTDSLHKCLRGYPVHRTVCLRSVRANGRTINRPWQHREHTDAKLLRIRHFLCIAGKKPLHAL